MFDFMEKIWHILHNPVLRIKCLDDFKKADDELHACRLVARPSSVRQREIGTRRATDDSVDFAETSRTERKDVLAHHVRSWMVLLESLCSFRGTVNRPLYPKAGLSEALSETAGPAI